MSRFTLYELKAMGSEWDTGSFQGIIFPPWNGSRRDAAHDKAGNNCLGIERFPSLLIFPVGAALPETDTGFVVGLSVCLSYKYNALDGLRRAIMKMTKVSRTSG